MSRFASFTQPPDGPPICTALLLSAWGVFAPEDGRNHDWTPDWMPADESEAVTADGTLFQFDEVFTQASQPYTVVPADRTVVGAFLWPIQWYYKPAATADLATDRGRYFATIFHTATAYKDGSVEVTKGTATSTVGNDEPRIYHHPIHPAQFARRGWWG